MQPSVNNASLKPTQMQTHISSRIQTVQESGICDSLSRVGVSIRAIKLHHVIVFAHGLLDASLIKTVIRATSRLGNIIKKRTMTERSLTCSVLIHEACIGSIDACIQPLQLPHRHRNNGRHFRSTHVYANRVGVIENTCCGAVPCAALQSPA